MMHYYVMEWDNEEVDEPFRIYVELDQENRIRRKVEFYRVGMGQYYEDLCTEPVDISELAGEGTYIELQRSFFESAVAQVYELSGGLSCLGGISF